MYMLLISLHLSSWKRTPTRNFLVCWHFVRLHLTFLILCLSFRKTWRVYVATHQNWHQTHQFVHDEDMESDLSSFILKCYSFSTPFLTHDQIWSECVLCRTRWGTNQLTRGSYSFVKVGSSQQDILELGKPVKSKGHATVSSTIISWLTDP